jgi:diaminohydroxyphosphoribosylaminopyrimidine deaminase/5-amino-6-(5-phosphoribosylamino)uracil reductase
MQDKANIKYMKIALSLASRNIGLTAPNPSVGCVIVKDGQIIASGITSPGGRPHAETNTLNSIGDAAKGATAYITLEPCSHTGKTNPCTEALIKSGIAKVVVAMEDPFPKVAGSGIMALKAAGIDVVQDICQTEAAKLNEGFLSVQLKKRPFVTLKMATSIDGKIATSFGESKWITGVSARNYTQILRAKNDAIMVGIETVFTDDPELTCRLNGLENQSPIRVVMDSHLRIPEDSKLVKTAKKHPLWVICSDVNADKKTLESLGVKIITCKADDNLRIDLADALKKLVELGITRLLVEGGSKLASSFITANLVDELVWIKAPILIGNDGIPAISDLEIANLKDVKKFALKSVKKVCEDLVEVYRVS